MNEQAFIFKAINQCEDLKCKIEEACGDDQLRKQLSAIYEKKRRYYVGMLNLFEKEISKLDIREQIALRMYCIDWLGMSEISEKVGCSKSYMKKFIKRAAGKLTDPRVLRLYNERTERRHIKRNDE